ncbi:hypothetical protein P8452_63199 [Trifolium repens]|nr:hypothetical protein P8452_63199 [Trifolium repens]
MRLHCFSSHTWYHYPYGQNIVPCLEVLLSISPNFVYLNKQKKLWTVHGTSDATNFGDVCVRIEKRSLSAIEEKSNSLPYQLKEEKLSVR